MPFMQPRDVVTFVTSEMLYGIPSAEDNARNILATLGLQDTLILCGRLNAVVSGIGTVSIEDRIRPGKSTCDVLVATRQGRDQKLHQVYQSRPACREEKLASHRSEIVPPMMATHCEDRDQGQHSLYSNRYVEERNDGNGKPLQARAIL